TQASRETRLASATRVIDNGGTMADLTKQVEALARHLDLTPG
ncbi:MAG: hypothetical protein QOG99_3867, partial [Frankiales bacterium]|nr:hypothetical protein [Frankiales bacterium]